MGKKGYNWKSRQVVKTIIDDSSTKKIELDLPVEGHYDNCNELVLPSKKRKTKIKKDKQEVTKILSKKHRKKLEKIVERKQKKQNRASLLEELTKVKIDEDEIKKLTSIASIQTKGLKRYFQEEYDLEAETKRQKIDTDDEKLIKLNSIKGQKRNRTDEALNRNRMNSNDPNIVGFDSSSSDDEDNESNEEDLKINGCTKGFLENGEQFSDKNSIWNISNEENGEVQTFGNSRSDSSNVQNEDRSRNSRNENFKEETKVRVNGFTNHQNKDKIQNDGKIDGKNLETGGKSLETIEEIPKNNPSDLDNKTNQTNEQKNATKSNVQIIDQKIIKTQRSIKSEITHKPAVYVNVYRDEKIQAERLKLPILSEEQPIMETINNNLITVIIGETGSGKTTQIPQFLYEAGYARTKQIGITEPRRVAAQTMSRRLCYEMNLPASTVSYLIRFEGNCTKDTKIKFMTDGVLLKEIESDFLLKKYSVIILDEIHERTIYTDILIGLLSRIVLVRNRSEDKLKLILMSATLDLNDFLTNEKLFRVKPAVVNVAARQFPVTVHFNRRTHDDYLNVAYRKAIKIHQTCPDGGILIFVTGQQEVNSLVKRLRRTFPINKRDLSRNSKKERNRNDNNREIEGGVQNDPSEHPRKLRDRVGEDTVELVSKAKTRNAKKANGGIVENPKKSDEGKRAELPKKNGKKIAELKEEKKVNCQEIKRKCSSVRKINIQNLDNEKIKSSAGKKRKGIGNKATKEAKEKKKLKFHVLANPQSINSDGEDENGYSDEDQNASSAEEDQDASSAEMEENASSKAEETNTSDDEINNDNANEENDGSNADEEDESNADEEDEINADEEDDEIEGSAELKQNTNSDEDEDAKSAEEEENMSRAEEDNNASSDEDENESSAEVEQNASSDDEEDANRSSTDENDNGSNDEEEDESNDEAGENATSDVDEDESSAELNQNAISDEDENANSDEEEGEDVKASSDEEEDESISEAGENANSAEEDANMGSAEEDESAGSAEEDDNASSDEEENANSADVDQNADSDEEEDVNSDQDQGIDQDQGVNQDQNMISDDQDPNAKNSNSDEEPDPWDKKLQATLKRKQKKKKRKIPIIPKINLDDYGIPGDTEMLDDENESLLSSSDEEIDDVIDKKPLWVLPMYSLLSSEEQAKVFKPAPNNYRLCIISTNIAETSITIPHIKYVIDTGRTKVKLYDKLTGVTNYMVTFVSKASAKQRAGRAGRVSSGHCYRLYSSAVYDSFAEFNEPEIKKKSIEDLYLKMKSMGIGRIENFPFPTQPDFGQLKQAEKNLKILGALDQEIGTITDLGKAISKFPLLPKYGKMLALSQQFDLIEYTICLVSALSVQEVLLEIPIASERTKPKEERQKLLAIRRQWAGIGNSQLLGDCSVLLKAVGGAEFANSENQLSQFCQKTGLREKALIEIRKLRLQLTNDINMNLANAGVSVNPKLKPPSDLESKLLRQILLAGLGNQIARKIPSDEQQATKHAYQANNIEESVYIYRNSVLRRLEPEFVVFQEIYEVNNKLFIRGLTAIEPEWLPMYVPSLCNLSKPLTDPEPCYVNHKIYCTVSGSFGEQAWPLPNCRIEFPMGLDRYKWFAKFFLDGLVFTELKKYRGDLLNSSNLMVKSWAKLQSRTEDLLKGLVAKRVSSRDLLEEIWKDDSTYLLKEYLKWLPESAHSEVRVIWPPKN